MVSRVNGSTLYNKGSLSPNIEFGHPGQVDASGDLLAQRLPTSIGMPAFASLTDIPSVWRQSEYEIGQWDGSVGNQYIRNLAAQIAVVPGKTVDRRVGFKALQFVAELPPPPFPFPANDPAKNGLLVKKGEALFQKNCADCHKSLNTKIYSDIGTDMNRANIMTRVGTLLVGKIFLDACNATLPDGSSPPACGNLLTALSSNPLQSAGYPAKPLAGIWARAPYLHNGSVPTLRHLLSPAERPKTFVRGSLGYDSEFGGFNWDIKNLDAYRSEDPEVDVVNTDQDGLSSKGHDQIALRHGLKSYRLNWTRREGDDPRLLMHF